MERLGVGSDRVKETLRVSHRDSDSVSMSETDARVFDSDGENMDLVQVGESVTEADMGAAERDHEVDAVYDFVRVGPLQDLLLLSCAEAVRVRLGGIGLEIEIVADSVVVLLQAAEALGDAL